MQPEMGTFDSDIGSGKMRRDRRGIVHKGMQPL